MGPRNLVPAFAILNFACTGAQERGTRGPSAGEEEPADSIAARLSALERDLGELRQRADRTDRNLHAELDRLDDEMDRLRLQVAEAEAGGASRDELLAEVRGRIPELERAYRNLVFRIQDASRPGER